MAAGELANVTKIFKWNVFGRFRFACLSVPVASIDAAADDEYIGRGDTGMHNVITGWAVPVGDTTANMAVRTNYDGTNGSTLMGAMALECSTTDVTSVTVFVIGR